jgi:hypothetical protein
MALGGAGLAGAAARREDEVELEGDEEDAKPDE